ncbi:MAG: type II-A CRISPR-associated protein Csn2, partial [Lachnospiraceae bacterium]
MLFIAYIIDPFSLDFNQRKIMTRMYGSMKELAMSPELYLETNTILVNVEKYIMQLIEHAEYTITYGENMDIMGIFKMADLKMETTYESLVEKIVDYLK